MMARPSVQWRTELWGGIVTLAVLVSGCPWSAANSTSSGADEEPIDDSAEAMVGTYRLESRAAGQGGCETPEPVEVDEPGYVRIEPAEPTPGDQREALAIRLCRGEPSQPDAGESCARPVWEARLTRAPKGGSWRSRRGEASAVDGASWVRRCRLELTTTRALPRREGMRIERATKRQEVALEGNLACRNRTALEYEDQLRCVGRTVWQAE